MGGAALYGDERMRLQDEAHTAACVTYVRRVTAATASLCEGRGEGRAGTHRTICQGGDEVEHPELRMRSQLAAQDAPGAPRLA